MDEQRRKEAQDVDASTIQPLSQPAHTLSPEATLKELSTNADEGLSSQDVQRRLEEHGPNELEGGESVSFAKIVIRQIANAMMLLSFLLCPSVLLVYANALVIKGPYYCHGG